jgi:hypothetical protein
MNNLLEDLHAILERNWLNTYLLEQTQKYSTNLMLYQNNWTKVMQLIYFLIIIYNTQQWYSKHTWRKA